MGVGCCSRGRSRVAERPAPPPVPPRVEPTALPAAREHEGRHGSASRPHQSLLCTRRYHLRAAAPRRRGEGPQPPSFGAGGAHVRAAGAWRTPRPLSSHSALRATMPCPSLPSQVPPPAPPSAGSAVSTETSLPLPPATHAPSSDWLLRPSVRGLGPLSAGWGWASRHALRDAGPSRPCCLQPGLLPPRKEAVLCASVDPQRPALRLDTENLLGHRIPSSCSRRGCRVPVCLAQRKKPVHHCIHTEVLRTSNSVSLPKLPAFILSESTVHQWRWPTVADPYLLGCRVRRLPVLSMRPEVIFLNSRGSWFQPSSNRGTK